MKWHYRVGDNIYYNKLEAIQNSMLSILMLDHIFDKAMIEKKVNHNYQLTSKLHTSKMTGKFIV